MALHEKPGKTDEWYTPEYVFKAMGVKFDLDVASPKDFKPEWIPAAKRIVDHSLFKDWWGFVWMNAPFGGRNGLRPWLNKFINHRNGICLVPDRTSAPWWNQAAKEMDFVLFVSPKIKFLDKKLRLGRSPAQGTCLMSIGHKGNKALKMAQKNGLGCLMKYVCEDRASS